MLLYKVEYALCYDRQTDQQNLDWMLLYEVEVEVENPSGSMILHRQTSYVQQAPHPRPPFNTDICAPSSSSDLTGDRESAR